MNQIEASYLKELGIYGHFKTENLVIDEFHDGYQSDLNLMDKEMLESIKQNITGSFSYNSVQKCKDLFIADNKGSKTAKHGKSIWIL